jgi:hypothetical protein
MRRLLIATLLVPASLTLAMEEKAAAPSGENPMAGWRQPKVTNAEKDKKEIHALFQAMETAGKRGDVEAAASLVDFPVLMATDNAEGQGMAETWTREQWIERMKPFYGKPHEGKTTHKPTVFLLSDSLASVDDVATMQAGPRSVTMRNHTLLIKRDGKWLIKAMAEGGWGDVMAPAKQAGGEHGEPGAASEGTGSGAQTPGHEPGSQAPGAPSGGAPSGGAQGGTERTTK